MKHRRTLWDECPLLTQGLVRELNCNLVSQSVYEVDYVMLLHDRCAYGTVEPGVEEN
jgi:hypothetical protein